MSPSSASSNSLWMVTSSSYSGVAASATLALCSSVALGYIFNRCYYRSSSSSNHRSQRRRQGGKGMNSTDSATTAITGEAGPASQLAEFIAPEHIGRIIVVSKQGSSNNNNFQTGTSALTTTTTTVAHQHDQPLLLTKQHHPAATTPSISPPSLASAQESPRQQPLHDLDAMETIGITTNGSRARDAAALEVVSQETLEAIKTHPDFRIWDHVIIGEGSETLDSACRLALQHPTRTVLLVLEQDVRPSAMQRTVLWLQRTLAAHTQRLWAHEALRAVPSTMQDTVPALVEHKVSPPREAPFYKSRPIDLASLPPNLSISPKLFVTKILIDKPITDHQPVTPTSTSPLFSTMTRPVKRFNNLRGELHSNLTIDTTATTPAKTVGLELVATQEPTADVRYQLFCKNSIAFANDKHSLVHALNTTTTPPTSRDGAGGRRKSALSSDDQSPSSRMVFSICMQHIRPKENPEASNKQPFSPLATIYQHLLTRASRTLDRLSRNHGFVEEPVSMNIALHPVLLHQSDRVLESGRVRLATSEDAAEEILKLEISVSTPSLATSAPIEIHVKVSTHPIVQDAFGNADMITKGEAVLLEGLVIAREMARTVGWICLAEDDSQMVEWVRDQMSIRWLDDTVTMATPLQAVCETVEGLHTFSRPRAFSNSNSSLRIKTPTISPYASRTHSYRGGKRREDLGLGNRRDSTMQRLLEVTENLQSQENQAPVKEDVKDFKESKDTKPRTKVTIAAVEELSLPGSGPGRKTSFGGFSALSETRYQTLARAEETEDHLGLALSIGTPKGAGNGAPVSPIEPTTAAFAEGFDFLGGSNVISNNDNTTPPRKLSRFSIKSYQLERNNHGLSNEWGIGLGSSAASKNDLLSTPPLLADIGLSGTVSPLTPNPGSLPIPDFLQGLGADPSNRKQSPQMDLPQFTIGVGEGLGSDDTFSSGSSLGYQDKSAIDSESGRGIGVFGLNRHGSSPSGVSSFRRNSSYSHALGSSNEGISPLEAPVELVHDFLSDKFLEPPPQRVVSFGRFKPSALAVSPSDVVPAPLGRNQSVPIVGSTKVVHFATSEEDSTNSDGISNGTGGFSRLKRSQSEPAAPAMAMDQSVNVQEDDDTAADDEDDNGTRARTSTSSSSSSSSSFSKSKAHTRRSWGQGIGGNDILGIHGLSE
ncbi:hypothetical protein BGZ98_010033 [Dissophora globulifera]|nr:hypothetical protein BGZ98_010033 [Dissophora globulifera]